MLQKDKISGFNQTSAPFERNLTQKKYAKPDHVVLHNSFWSNHDNFWTAVMIAMHGCMVVMLGFNLGWF